jgi:hypothetical protein
MASAIRPIFKRAQRLGLVLPVTRIWNSSVFKRSLLPYPFVGCEVRWRKELDRKSSGEYVPMGQMP